MENYYSHKVLFIQNKALKYYRKAIQIFFREAAHTV